MSRNFLIALFALAFIACDAGAPLTAESSGDATGDGSQLSGDVIVDAGSGSDSSARDPETVADGLGCGSILEALAVVCVPEIGECTVSAKIRECGVVRTVFAQVDADASIWCENGDCLTL